MKRIILFALIAGCANAQTVKEDSMSADEHRESAAKHHERGDTHTSVAVSDPMFGVDTYDLDNYHDTEANRDHTLAEQHTAAAESLEAFEDAQCAEFPKATRTRCPLIGTVAAVKDVENGVEIHG